MKRYFSLILVFVLMLSFTACMDGTHRTNRSESTENTEETSESVSEENTENLSEYISEDISEDTSEDISENANEESEPSIIGSWEDAESGFDETFTFNADNTGSYSIMGNESPYTYSLDGNSLSILYSDGTDVKYTVTYDDVDLEMSDTFGNKITCIKK